MPRRKPKKFQRREYFQVPECFFCTSDQKPDYKTVENLRRFVSDRGKIIPRSRSGLCAKHQRQATRAIKRARFLALLPFAVKI
ncbi:30S ribosomal protein S18 [Candidatus Shapirobacteria bacterium CG10_big_fil_rev_8_21_14_0_10_38_14]|uniref:Small ribosomal subunit protein bS18 n=1 Tax=Candidatus Shapirobacteria bacterium CG10_big_fil_rev_8_21_14_0_10_38_14 TaxID=1974483 RepID=A0A2M8L4X4_9BACT|nr:MAG: 30S ribosomal protein S18 [Candidatus Shapirobacteria bacterium CG10_big_fil_rev_8_21_14_0_10_38_14]